MTHDKFKGGFGGRRVGPGIMHILRKWEPAMPSGLTVVDENAEILFEPLICAFRLAVSLGVVSGAYVLFDIKDAAKFLREVGGEAGISVRNNLSGSAVVWEDMLDVKVGNSGGGGCFVAGNENSCFGAVVVHNSEDAIKAVQEREFNDEIHGDGFKGKGGAVGGDGAMRDTGARGDGFGGLTGGAAANEGGDKGFHVGPPVIFGDEKAGFEYAGMTCGGGIVV